MRDRKGRFVKKDAVVTGFKAFDKDMKCRGFQFEEGKTYTHDGKIAACESGFHLCENPLDVLNYYDLCDSRFAKVTASGSIDRHNDDTKIAAATITIDAEIKLPEFIKSAVNFIMWLCRNVKSGNSSKLAASGNSSKLAASGDSSQLAASGNYSKLAASGYSSKLAASGDSSKLAASGNYSKLAASGDSSQLAASGYSSKLAASGDSSIIMAAATDCKAKAGELGTIALSYWVGKEKRYRVSVAYVGEDGIKPDTWYMLNNKGEFIEVK